MSSIGHRIKIFREKKGLTQEQLAEALGISNSTMVRWENTNMTPNVKELIKICRILGVSVGDIAIMDDSEDNATGTFEATAILSADSNDLPPTSQKDMVYRYTKNGETHSLEITFYALTPKEEKLEIVEKLLKKTFGDK